MTPAQQVSWIRDVPVSCICEMRWQGGRWVRTFPHRNCPWHGKADQR